MSIDAATGHSVWARSYNGSGDGIDHAQGVAVSPDGREIVVIGYSENMNSDLDFVTVAYSATTGGRFFQY